MTSDRGTSGGAELELNNTPVTPKSAALNPNASVFLSVKTSTPGAQPSYTGQYDHNDSGIGNTTNSTSDFSYTNGDISVDKSDAGVFSPTSDSPFQADLPTFTDNHNFNENSSATMKLEETVGNLLLDNTGMYGVDAVPPAANFSGVEAVPMTGIQYSTENGNADGDTEGNVTDDQLRHVLKNQLESYCSRENLSNDSYLQSQMDADQYVPVATVANLDQIQKLTSDTQLIVDLLRESNFVQDDEKGVKVRPNHNRCIVILREIPESTPVADVQGLFGGANCPKFVSCEFAHNSNWYVTFDAQRAYQYLREEVGTFLGKPIMARIKAKPLIHNYPRNGYINKRFQPPPPVTAQLPTEVVTSSAPQPQFTATQPFTLMPNVLQYLNSQQAIPFYPPPPNPLLQAWTSPTTIMDPSMVLAMNGYQATSVNVNSQVNNRNMFNSVSRTTNNNTRNQKQHGNSGQPMGRDRINSNDSLPPRLQHQQHERQQHNSVNNMHKNSQPISTHASAYQGRRGDGPGHVSHNNHSSHHSHHGNHSHGGHSTPMSHPPHHHQHPPQSMPHHQGHHMHQQSQHLDGNNNTNNNNSNGASLHNRTSQGMDLSQRYAGKSYKSRRRREEDGARPNRSNSSQPSTRDGQSVHQARPMSIDKFDYEPTSFPPLPGSGNNASSGEIFESKLSDVVKGTAKPQVKDVPKPVSAVLPVSTATTTVTTSKPNMSSSREDEVTPSSNQCLSSSSSCLTSAAPVTKSTTGNLSQQPTVSQQVRCSASTIQSVPDSRAGREPDVKSNKDRELESRPNRDRQQQQSNSDDNTASLSANSVKLSYAQMVQKTKVAEVSANSLADQSDESESEDADSSQAPNRALKEQGQHPTQSSSKPSTRGSGKDFSRKDSRENESDSRRDDKDLRKENDYRRDEPREQRNRRLKENRGERRYGGDRDFSYRNDRRGRDGPQARERDAPKPATAAAIAK
ncbi:la-related protein 4-like isoform X2 [Ruditapes philippinarum]|uniref:la-related protein 4-like isoform X2 n=1 Tax=Ruditapes philippinarum TaxID=129788 RepID=UPI00295AC409|nr:la-related protein 4-like isoform X2 [Ruditapes philippinarum]XP_060592316.1 la-related protein 4-like isoform X2 [Ruditapes philippinarum]